MCHASSTIMEGLLRCGAQVQLATGCPQPIIIQTRCTRKALDNMGLGDLDMGKGLGGATTSGQSQQPSTAWVFGALR